MIGSVDLSPAHRAIVERILAEHVPECEVRAFGSRATWTAKDYSDLDLAVVNQESLDRTILSRLNQAFEESNLPMRVDIVDWHAISESFREVIEHDYAVLQKGAERSVSGKWRKHEVSALIKDKALVIGDGYRAKNSELSKTGLPFARAGNISGGFQFADADCFPESQLHRVGDKISRSGDTVFTSKGTVGRFAFVSSDTSKFVYSPQLSFWRSLDWSVLHPRFLFYWMQSTEFFNQFKSVAGQTDMAEYVSLRDQRQMHITLPPLSEQRAIAHILGTLDDKIELNRRMNQTLEEMARALFESWFVDFDPVRAKAALKQQALRSHAGPDAEPCGNGSAPEGEWTVERARAYLDTMDPQIANLFPDRLVCSELGQVPEGWEVKVLADCIAVTRGLSYKGSGLSSDGTPMHNLNSLYEGGGYKDDGIKYYNGDYKDRHVTQPGEVLVANTEQGHDRLLIGFAAIVPRNHGDRGVFSHHLYRITPNRSSGLSPDYICHLLNTQSMHNMVSGYATGTTVNMLPIDALRIPAIVLPPARLVNTFSSFAEAAREKQYSFLMQCHSLAAQQSALLPELLSEKIKSEGAS